MEKRLAKLQLQKDKNPVSCSMWGLIDLLDFRHARVNRKLLSNGRASQKHIAESGVTLDVVRKSRSTKKIVLEGQQLSSTSGGSISEEVNIFHDRNNQKRGAYEYVEQRIVGNHLDDANVHLVQSVAKAFVDQMFTERRQINHKTGSSDSKPFQDALRSLNLSRDVFLKLLQDPNSKYTQRLQCTKPEREKIRQLLNEKLSDGGSSDLRLQCNTMIQKRSTQSNKYNNSSTGASSSKIVVLKATQKSSRCSADVSCHCSSIPSQCSFVKGEQNGRYGNSTFGRITRKLKLTALGEDRKEHNLISLDAALDKLRREKETSRTGENSGKPVNSSTGVECKGKLIRKLKAENEQQFISSGRTESFVSRTMLDKLNLSSSRYSHKQELDIFLEGKRHLSERLRNANKGEPLTSDQTTRTLWRILSSPEHDISVVYATKSEKTTGYVPEQAGFSPDKDLQRETKPSMEILVEKKTHVELPFEPKMDVISSKEVPEIVRSHDKNGYFTCSILASPSEHQPLCSSSDLSAPSPLSPCRFSDTESKYTEEHKSPVSVLDRLFTEDVNSPTSTTTTESDKKRLQPGHINFDEYSHIGFPEDAEIDTSILVDDHDSLSEYVRSILRASHTNWGEAWISDLSTDKLIPTSLFEELDLFLPEIHCDTKLLFDYITEVLSREYQCFSGIFSQPLASRTKIGFTSLEEYLVDKVVKEVNRGLIPRTVPPTLQDFAENDLKNSGFWLDTGSDTVDNVVQIAEDVLDELVFHTVLESFT